MIGDKSICKIISYTKEKRTFTVQEVYSQTEGYLPLSKDLLKDKTKLFDAMKQGKNIPLLCVKVMNGKPVYSSNMQALDEISKEERLTLVHLTKNLVLTLHSLRDYNEAIITQGGISVKEINPTTMESKLVSHLYFAGEVLDLDAFTGGYNLQIAWSTGYAAGNNLC